MTWGDAWCVPGPLRVRSIIIPESELTWRFSRSSGPGGQGVNTTDSRVELVFDLANSSAFGPTLRARALERLAGRLVDGVLTIAASEHRSQLRNREAAEERLVDVLTQATAPPSRPRRPTRPSKAAKERRIAQKRRRSNVKRLRRPGRRGLKRRQSDPRNRNAVRNAPPACRAYRFNLPAGLVTAAAHALVAHLERREGASRTGRGEQYQSICDPHRSHVAVGDENVLRTRRPPPTTLISSMAEASNTSRMAIAATTSVAPGKTTARPDERVTASFRAASAPAAKLLRADPRRISRGAGPEHAAGRVGTTTRTRPTPPCRGARTPDVRRATTAESGRAARRAWGRRRR